MGGERCCRGCADANPAARSNPGAKNENILHGPLLACTEQVESSAHFCSITFLSLYTAKAHPYHTNSIICFVHLSTFNLFFFSQLTCDHADKSFIWIMALRVPQKPLCLYAHKTLNSLFYSFYCKSTGVLDTDTLKTVHAVP